MKQVNVRVSVTPEDIACGAKGSYTSCPIALAVRRAVPELTYASVSDTMVSARTKIPKGSDARYHGTLPKEAGDFVNAFDWGKEVVPFDFSLTLEQYLWE